MKKKTERELLALLKQDAFHDELGPYVEKYELPIHVLEELFNILYIGYKIPDEEDDRRWRGYSDYAGSVLWQYGSCRSFPKEIKEWLQNRININTWFLQDCGDITEEKLPDILKQEDFHNVLVPYCVEYRLPMRVLEELFNIVDTGYKIPDEKDERKWRGLVFEALSTLIFYKNQRFFPVEIKVWLQERIKGDTWFLQDCK